MEQKELFDLLHKTGLRVTPQRIAICELLLTAKDHPTASEIYGQLKSLYPSMSLATVYNTLDILVQMGLINALCSVGDDMAHFDANLKPHINLACNQCHRITDFDSDQVGDLDFEIAEKSGYQINGSSILYFGICPDCLQKTI